MKSADPLGLAHKNIVVLGVADQSSIAWGIASAFAAHGARVTIGYQQKFFSRVRLLLKGCPEMRSSRCDVLNDEELDSFFAPFRGDPIDVLVHSIAHGPPEIFTRYASEVGFEGIHQTMEVSAFSLLRVVRFAKPSLRRWASVMAMSSQAATRALPMYGMMGVAKSGLESVIRYLAIELGKDRIRVNGISPGPMETLAAYGEILAIRNDPEALRKQRGTLMRVAMAKADEQTSGGDTQGLDWVQAVARNVRQSVQSHCSIQEPVSQEDVAGCALFLGSQLSTKITGQIIHVDCGLSGSLIL